MPVVDRRIVVGKRSLSECKTYRLCLPRHKFHLGKIAKLLFRTDHRALLVCHIELYDLFSCHLPGIGDVHGHRHGIGIFELLFVYPQVRIIEGCVGKSVSEREQHIHLFLIIIAVADKDAFPVLYHISLTDIGEIRRIVLQLLRKCLRKPAARIYFSKKNVAHSAAYRLTSQIGFHDSLHLIRPGHLHRRAIVKHNDGVRLYRSHLRDQLILTVGHPHMSSVIAFRFKRVRKSRKNDSNVSFCRGLYCILQQCFVCLVFIIHKALRIGDVRHILDHIPRRRHLMAVDMGASASLIARLLHIFTDKSDLLLFLKRQNPLVFQQNDRLLRHLARQLMILIPVKDSGLVAVLFIAEYNVQDPLNRLIYHAFLQRAALYRSDDQLIVRSAGRRHLQIQSSL